MGLYIPHYVRDGREGGRLGGDLNSTSGQSRRVHPALTFLLASLTAACQRTAPHVLQHGFRVVPASHRFSWVNQMVGQVPGTINNVTVDAV